MSYATETFWKAKVASGFPGNLLNISEHEVSGAVNSEDILWVASPTSRKIGTSDSHLIDIWGSRNTEDAIQVVAGKNLEHFGGVNSTIVH